MSEKPEIVIVGGGPVGLFLGICLIKQGTDCLILEKRKNPVPDSRSLGIHPPSLRLFKQLDVIEPFLKAGLKIKTGLAYNTQTLMGTIDFESTCPKPFNYILACPQSETERILRDEFLALAPDKLITEAQVFDLHFDETSVNVFYTHEETSKKIKVSYIIGCDGKNSLIRQKADILLEGKRYPDTYIMGDFEDITSFGDKAAVFLPKQGMIECFPLPNGMRRWVVKTDMYYSNATANDIVELVKDRINFDLSVAKNTMLSSFGVQHFIAESFFKDSVILCGDSAHVVSPIGGQGMNLGWIGAWELSKVLSFPESKLPLLKHYQNTHRKRVIKAAKRAELNMQLGRKRTFPFLRNSVLRLMLNTPLKKKMAQQFTMQGLLPEQEFSTA